MRPTVLFVLLMAGCADPQRPLSVPDLWATPHGELSLLYDAGDQTPRDLSLAPSDLAGADLAGVDLAGVDLAGGCGAARLVVNEVKTGSAASGTDEFVELFNPCPTDVALAGLTLKYRSAADTGASDTNLVATLTGSIPAGGYYLVANTNYTGTGAPDLQPFQSSGLASTGGAVGLRNGAAIIDSVGWGTAANPFVEKSAAVAPANGHSIGRLPNGSDSDDNSKDFQSVAAPTPKAKN